MALKKAVHTFNIRITDNVKGWMWYANKQGEKFKAKNYDKRFFILVDDKRVVFKTDCEIVK